MTRWLVEPLGLLVSFRERPEPGDLLEVDGVRYRIVGRSWSVATAGEVIMDSGVRIPPSARPVLQVRALPSDPSPASRL